MPIFTAGAIAGQVEAAEAGQQQALFAYQKAIQRGFREVNDALVDQDRTREQLEAQKRCRRTAAVCGYGTPALRERLHQLHRVLDAERSLFNARLQYTQSQQIQFQAIINLYPGDGRRLGGRGRQDDPGGRRRVSSRASDSRPR